MLSVNQIVKSASKIYSSHFYI